MAAGGAVVGEPGLALVQHRPALQRILRVQLVQRVVSIFYTPQK